MCALSQRRSSLFIVDVTEPCGHTKSLGVEGLKCVYRCVIWEGTSYDYKGT